MATVSVVVIFYNAEPFLEDAIESVLGQRWVDWELLLVDDGSTDGSNDLALRYAMAKPAKMRCLHHPAHENRGMSASRNLGLENATGQYVCFLDADDVLEPTAIEEQVAILETAPDVSMVYGSLQHWYSWTGDQEDRERDFIRATGIVADTVVDPPELLVRFLSREIPAPSGMLVRRSTAQDVGGFEDEFRDLYEDQAFCAKICLKLPVYVAEKYWYRYRQHPNSNGAIADISGQYEAGRLEFLTWLHRYLIEQDCTNTVVWRTLQREFWLYEHPRLHNAWRRARRGVRKIRSAFFLYPR